MIALLLALQVDWPTYHGGYSLDGVAREAPPDVPERLWRYKSGARVETTPISSGGRIFFATDKGVLTALDLSGAELWKAGLEKDFFTSPPMTADGLVVVGTGNGELAAFDVADGRRRWTHATEDTILGSANRVELPEGKKGIAAICQSAGSIHCVDGSTGAIVWKTEPFERCDGSAGIGGGWVVMGSCASALHVFSASTGEKKADVDLGEDAQVAGGVAVSGTTAYAGTRSGAFCAVDLSAGKLLWTNGDGRGEAFATPAVGARLVVFASDGGKVFGLARDTGAKVWEFDAEGRPGSPAIAGNRVVVTAGGALVLLELETGRQVWRQKISDAITSPAVVGGRILVGADDGTISAFGKR